MSLLSLSSQLHTVHLFLSIRLIYLREGKALARTPVLCDCCFTMISSLSVIFVNLFLELFDYGSIKVIHVIS